MTNPFDIRPTGAAVHLLPVQTRVPLKFGPETLTYVTCARVAITVEGRDGQRATGWGETPLSVQWVWPGSLPYAERQQVLLDLCGEMARAWAAMDSWGHPLELGIDFQRAQLVTLTAQVNQNRAAGKEMPWLAALVCCSAFDIALHDAYGKLHGRPVYETYAPPYLGRDLSTFLQPAADSRVNFQGLYPADFLSQPPSRLPAWHLVGGLDPLEEDELSGNEPQDGYPVLLKDWIERDGLKCLKVKLRGTDAGWDYNRLRQVGEIAIQYGVHWLSADFNCTVTEPAYVNDILDRLLDEQPRIYGMLLYVEQPFPYDLEAHQIDVHSLSARKPLFMDESAHDWRLVRLGRSLGWSGVALKTCKTQSGALLSLCWAKAHGMTLMVQDLTNPMLAQIPHVLLAAHAGTIMGVETNAVQFYPQASNLESSIHPGIYRRREGRLDLSTLNGPGFGYGGAISARQLPAPVAVYGTVQL